SGGEIVFAMTFYPDTEALACERLAPVSQGFLENILQITQRVSVHQGEVADAGGAGKHLRYLIDGLLTGIRCRNFQLLPIPLNVYLHREAHQKGAQIVAQLTNHPLTHRHALDEDFGEDFDNEMHETAPNQKGARLYPKRAKPRSKVTRLKIHSSHRKQDIVATNRLNTTFLPQPVLRLRT